MNYALPNPFSNSGVYVPEAPESAAAIACPQPRAVAAFLSPGDIDENLHDLQSATPVRSVPPRRDGGGGRSLGEMQDVRETKKTRKAHGSAGEDTRPAESPGAQSTSACREDWKNSETGPLRNVSRVDAKKCSRRPSQGLLETASSDMGLSQLSWSGTLNMETIGLADLSVSDGVGAKPILAPSEAATDPGRAVAATLVSDGKDVPARMQGSNDRGLARDDVKPGDTMQESRPAHPATAPSGLHHNAITQAVEIQSSCGGTGVQPFVHAEAAWEVPAPRNISGKQEGRTGIEVGTSQTPGSPMLSARTLPIPSGQAPGPHEANNDLEQLIGVAGKRRRRPLALPRFAPDFPEIWKAMHDKTAPRTVLDPLWADASPLFLKG